MQRQPDEGRGSGPWIGAATVLVILTFAVTCSLIFRNRSAADLMAVWLAGEAMSLGRPDLLYPADTTLFSMQPPAEWIEWLVARGYVGDVFPFIYPPLWAGVAEMLARVVSLEAFQKGMATLLPALVGLMLVFAHRMAALRMQQAVYVAAGLVLIVVTYIGAIALHQNQPQIIVSLLVVAAIERSEAGAWKTAGTLLAVAAALKVVPVLYALIWVFAGRWREVSVFAAVGAALGALSVAVAGWPAHLEFLRMIGVISDTGVLIRFNYSLTTAAMQVFAPDRVVWVPDAMAAMDPARADLGYNVFPMPAGLSALSLLLQAAVAAVAGRMLVRRSGDAASRAAVWPFAITLIALLGPLSWSHHYLAAAAFLPLLILRLGPALAVALFGLLALLISPYFGVRGVPMFGLIEPLQILGTAVMCGVAVLFLIAARPPRAP